MMEYKDVLVHPDQVKCDLNALTLASLQKQRLKVEKLKKFSKAMRRLNDLVSAL